MAHEISQFTRPVAPYTGFPYGDIANDPSGTLVNRLFITDIIQFFQRMAADAGVTLNGTDDSSVNGYQFVQALNTFINRPSGMGAAFGCPSGSYIPVIMSGLVYTGYSGSWTLTAGYLFFNGLYYYCAAASGSSAPTTLVFYFSSVDGLPVMDAAMHSGILVPSPTQGNYTDAISWETSVGITTLQNDVAIAAWTDITAFSSGWAADGTYIPRFTKDGMGRVTMQGHIDVTGSTSVTSINTTPIPSDYCPSQNLYFTCTYWNNASGDYGTCCIVINTSGDILWAQSSAQPSNAGNYIDLSNINYITL